MTSLREAKGLPSWCTVLAGLSIVAGASCTEPAGVETGAQSLVIIEEPPSSPCPTVPMARSSRG